MILYPLDFEEFLWAAKEERLAKEIRKCFYAMESMPEALHQKAIELYRYYLIVGGMPASVETFLKSGKLVLVPTVQNEILNNYVADMAKYTTPSDTINPIAVYADLSSFKLYMSDVGLLVMKSGTPQQTILTGEANLFMGSITENYVAQALTSNGHTLFYWTSEHAAELDFVLQKDVDVIGVEVKKGIKVKSKSLSVFIQKYAPSYSIRFSEKNFGKSENVLSIPLYAVFCV